MNIFCFDPSSVIRDTEMNFITLNLCAEHYLTRFLNGSISMRRIF